MLPKSLTAMFSVSAPLAFRLPRYSNPSKAALMLARVPVKIMLVSLLPLPVVKLRPAIPDSVKLPLATLRVSCIGAAAASTSITATVLPPATLNTRLVSSLTFCAGGKTSAGPSLTALTVIATDVLTACAPPAPLLPWSLIVRFRLSAPLKSGLAL